MPMARPRSSCTTRSTKKASGGKWEMAIFLMGLFSEKGSTLRQPRREAGARDPCNSPSHQQAHLAAGHGPCHADRRPQISRPPELLLCCCWACTRLQAQPMCRSTCSSEPAHTTTCGVQSQPTSLPPACWPGTHATKPLKSPELTG